jgi:hypothetical protein
MQLFKFKCPRERQTSIRDPALVLHAKHVSHGLLKGEVDIMKTNVDMSINQTRPFDLMLNQQPHTHQMHVKAAEQRRFTRGISSS